MEKLLFLVFFSFITQQGFSQLKEPDLYIHELEKHTSDDTLRLNLLNQLARYYSRTNPGKGLKSADEAIALALKLHHEIKLAEACHNKGASYATQDEDSSALDLYNKSLSVYQQFNKKAETGAVFFDMGLVYQKSDYFKALEYYNKALTIFVQLRDSASIAKCCESIGVDHLYQSNYPRALEHLQKALDIFQHSGNKKGTASSLANLGLVYLHLENFEKALGYHQKSFEIYEQLGNKKGMADELGNLGNVYDNMDDSAKALKLYQKALAISTATGYKRGIASNLSNIGIVYNYYGNYSRALEYLPRAAAFYEQSGDKTNASLTFNEIAKIYCNASPHLLIQEGVPTGDRYVTAIGFHQKALALARQTGSVSHQAYALESLSSTYEKKKDFSMALQAFKEAVILRDSSLNDKKKREITRLEMQYEFDKKEVLTKAASDKKTALAAAEIKRQKIIRNASIGVGSMLLLVAFAGIVLYKRRKDVMEKKKESEFNVQVADTEMKALRAQMNPHFIFNSLNSIIDYIDKNNTTKATAYTTKFAKLMRMILENSEQKEIPLADDLEALELYMQLESMRLQNKFSYEIKVDQDIDRHNTLIPPLILQPFVENSIWHGLTKKQAHGKILIHIEKQGDMINCIVEDNGTGMQESMAGDLEKRSLGMKLTRARIDIINKLKKSNAGVEISNKEEGVRAEVRLPLELSF